MKLPPLLPRAALFAAALALTSIAGGCFAYRTSETARTQPAQAAPADFWPARDPAPLAALSEATPAEIPEFELPPDRDPAAVSAEARAALDRPEFIVTCNRIAGRDPGRGLLRVFIAPPAPPPTDDNTATFDLDELSRALTGGFEFNASFLCNTDVQAPRWAEAMERAEAFTQSRRESALANKALLPTGVADRVGLEEGIRIEIPPPPPAGSPPRRGLVLHYCSLFPNEYERAVVDRLTADGWAVVCFDTKSSVLMPRDPAAAAEIPQLQRQYDEQLKTNTDNYMDQTPEGKARWQAGSTRVMELSARLSDLRRGWFTLCDESDVDRAAAQAATAIDDTLADNAYAAEALLEYLAEARPDLPQRPLAIVGMSAGALAAPAVAARLGDRVDAVVLVGGGADIFQISRTSRLKKTGVQFRCDERTPAPQRLMPALHEACLARTRLDPYHLAPLLSRTPVLNILAAEDTVVPIASGQLLDRRLNNPDRMSFNMGHYELFYFLPKQAGAISRWLDRNTPRK